MRVACSSTCKGSLLYWLACALMSCTGVPQAELARVGAAKDKTGVMWMKETAEKVAGGGETVLRTSFEVHIPDVEKAAGCVR